MIEYPAIKYPVGSFQFQSSFDLSNLLFWLLAIPSVKSSTHVQCVIFFPKRTHIDLAALYSTNILQKFMSDKNFSKSPKQWVDFEDFWKNLIRGINQFVTNGRFSRFKTQTNIVKKWCKSDTLFSKYFLQKLIQSTCLFFKDKKLYRTFQIIFLIH